MKIDFLGLEWKPVEGEEWNLLDLKTVKVAGEEEKARVSLMDLLELLPGETAPL